MKLPGRQLVSTIIAATLTFTSLASTQSSGQAQRASRPPAETLRATLRAADVPTEPFRSEELNAAITSYAMNQSDPFLLAYYTADHSGLLKAPLHIIRYDRQSRDLRRSDLQDVSTLFQSGIPMVCLGSVLSIREYHAVVYINTHINPSAGCVILLSSDLSYKTALSGGLIGLLGDDYAVIEGSEIHFKSVHPVHVSVFDLKRNRSVQVYPFGDDPLRSQFSDLIRSRMPDFAFCRDHNAQCDPNNFDVSIRGAVAVNKSAKVFGFKAQFDADGFGNDAQTNVPLFTVIYVFREHNGAWEHRVFEARDLEQRFQVPDVDRLVLASPQAPF